MSISRPLALVADDEIFLRLGSAELLERLGFEVLEADCAANALRFFEEGQQISLLHTDVQMPGERNGLDLAREISRRWPATAIIVCSSIQPDAAMAIPQGCHFIRKPCTEALVRSALHVLEVAHTPAVSDGAGAERPQTDWRSG